MKYLNQGARFTRADGTHWDRGAEHVPTEEELIRLAHKLVPSGTVLPVQDRSEVPPTDGGTDEVVPGDE